MNFTELLASASRHDDALTIDIPETWQQGRATYGGLTAALCLEAALPHAAGRPPRSAQVAFVGPAAGRLVATPTLLREGKNTAFVSVRASNDLGVAAEAIIVFGRSRPSELESRHLTAPPALDPHRCGAFLRPDDAPPGFAAHFEMRTTGADDEPMFGRKPGSAELSMWLRHGDGTQPSTPTNVFGLADGPPPTAAVTLPSRVPLSSMTWMAEFLVDEFDTTDGWFLAHHVDDHTANGYASQAMTLYNMAREPVMIGRQSITIFA